MSKVNVIVFGGRLGQNMAVEFFENGSAMGRFSVANSVYTGRDSDGPSKSATTWLDCQWYSSRASSIQHLMVKGRDVVVTGQLRSFQSESMPSPKYYLHVEDVHPGELPASARPERLSAEATASALAAPAPRAPVSSIARAPVPAPAPVPVRRAPVSQPPAQHVPSRPVEDDDDEQWAFSKR